MNLSADAPFDGTEDTEDTDDPCADLPDGAVLEQKSCEEIWQLNARFPIPYYGCEEAAGDTAADSRQVFDLGIECADPNLDGFWLYGDLMAREGWPIVPSKLDLDDEGRPACVRP